jgi:hypothetical protein
VKRYGKYRRKDRISNTTTTTAAAPPESSSAATAAAAASIALKFHPKYVTSKNKTKHIMKISYISVNSYDKTATSQQNID